MKYYKLTNKKTKDTFTLSINQFHALNAQTIENEGSTAFSKKYEFKIVNPHSKENILTGAVLVGVCVVSYLLINLIFNLIHTI